MLFFAEADNVIKIQRLEKRIEKLREALGIFKETFRCECMRKDNGEWLDCMKHILLQNALQADSLAEQEEKGE